jgi:hypothetical protein
VELAWGRETLWLPGWAERLSVSRSTFRTLVTRFMKPIRWSESLSRPRLLFLTSPLSQMLIGLACLFLSIVLVLPVWGGNLIPAVAIGLFSLGVMQRDGLAVILGWMVTGLSIGVLILAWNLIVASFEVGWRWFQSLG